MFFTCDAKVPVRARARRERSPGATRMPSLSTVIETQGCTRRVRVAFVPETVSMPSATDTAAFPEAIGCRASRLIALLVVSIIELPYLEERLTAHAGTTRLRVRDDAARAREDARARAT